MALWSGRFKGSADELTQEFGASLPIDRALYRQDIAGSRAHASMLAKQGIISRRDMRDILGGLDGIERDIESGEFHWDIADEDIHMAIESELIRRIGEAGKRLHTARSRNDQVATDLRLATKALSRQLMEANLALRRVLLESAERAGSQVMPGYTHLQHAQPVLLSHHLLAYSWMLTRDFKRLSAAFDAADASPLGSAALAGTTYPINREMTAASLGFSRVTENSLDAVSNRDFLLDLEYACAVMSMHLSRLAEEFVAWSSSEFGFITLSDAYSTGSSIMPQKKNPDFAELVRGKTGRVFGNLVALLVVMKGLPLAYDKDMQEDKAGALDTAETLTGCLAVMSGMIETMTVNGDAMRSACETGFLAATDVADYLVRKGMPFREAHAVVGELVLACEKRCCRLEELSLTDLQRICPLFEDDIAGALDIDSVVRARTTCGGTAPEAVAVQLERARACIAEDEYVINALSHIVEMGPLA
ncbi:argininosuccinate lyase [Coriobacterium glomerans PW2]|uniref:Argininosuccinate lyase n=1 Tax=Coriobacterium glomerans (strain ATCC 49209 / DSM 20642 / JCM 10262 / PW2) TaxID=700015 RepID=F2N8C6_CORGP|nr:argininosuccinate lyase [Coriobacterium glomerans]AEB07309.1 argininosuccinate lyase [Coriobacterium glomerans PW2]